MKSKDSQIVRVALMTKGGMVQTSNRGLRAIDNRPYDGCVVIAMHNLVGVGVLDDPQTQKRKACAFLF